MLVCLLDELILGLCYSDLTLETGGFELNRMSFKWTLSTGFRMTFSLNKGLVWQFLGIKLDLFLKDYKTFDRARVLCPNKRRVVKVRFNNCKINGP